jgi:hypothetical protein
MTRWTSAAILVLLVVGGVPWPHQVGAQGPDLAGRWALDRGQSQFPPEIGFATDWLPTGGAGLDAASGGRGRRGSGADGGSGAFIARRESEDDARRVQQLTAEVRMPSTRLTIVETPAAVTITDDRGRSRTFHPDGREEVLQLDGAPVGVIARREAGRLSILYKVEQGRELKYTFSRTAKPQLVVEVQFLERGAGDTARRIYEPAAATDTMRAPLPATPGPAAGPPRPSSPESAGAGAPAGQLSGQPFNQQPDAELKGLLKLGVVVEDLSEKAAACGLNQGTLEAAVSKRLTDAGFSILRNSDEDSYLYVNIITTSLPTGFCVSRYDVSLYTHTTAKLSYQETPVLVQVSLLHKGGLTGGAPAAHGEGVLRGVQEYLDQFVTRIRGANK